jgi:hypothetical protein
MLRALGTDREKVVQELDGTYSVYACYDNVTDIPEEDKNLPPSAQIDRKIDRMLADHKVCKNSPNNLSLVTVRDVMVKELQSEIGHCIKRKAKVLCNQSFD